MEDFIDVPTYDPDYKGNMKRSQYGEYVNIEDYLKLLDAYRLAITGKGKNNE